MSDNELSLYNEEEYIDKFIEQLPKALFWDIFELCQWEGFWSHPGIIKEAMMFKATFKTEPNDVLLASSLKTGTTWLKALCVCIMQGNKEEEEDILVKDNPHFHVPTIESMKYYTKSLVHDLYTMPSPRLFHTHLPYRVLPDSIKNLDNNCKIIYLARNPKDTLISMWHFFNKNYKSVGNPFPLEKVVECFCNGVHQFGPFFEHVLEYWEESKKRPQNILFLKYEDLKMDPKKELNKIALFLGKPFCNEEELEKVLWRCSLERLQNLDVNKSGSIINNIPYSSYFRKGIVGDWKNYMTCEMEEQLGKITNLKLQGSGLEL